MDILRKEDLRQLLPPPGGMCVTIYMPTHSFGREMQQDPIRFRNLISEAQEQLQHSGMRSPDARKMLAPLEKFQDDGHFWQHQSDGLAIFLSSGSYNTFRLPARFDELLVVAPRYHIKPLLPLLTGDGQFFVLALSQNAVRLFNGTRFSINEVDLGETPTSLDEALRFDDPESQLQYHTATSAPGAKGRRSAHYFGQGVGVNDSKTDLLRFFHKLDDGVSDLLAEEKAPLVLAGVDYLLPVYQQASSYPSLLSEGIAGNPEQLSKEDLHQRAWEIVEPIYQAAQQEAREKYHRLEGSGSDQASHDLKEIVRAAHHGRIETLFVALSRQRWGVFFPQENRLELHAEPRPESQDLLDYAAAHTMWNGGSVFANAPGAMPLGTELAAILRY